MRKRTVTRKQVVQVTRDAVKKTREDGYEVSTALVRKVMKIAREKPEFAIGDWTIKDCGCLIGWLYGCKLGYDDLPDNESRLGISFDWKLREATGAIKDSIAVVKVVD